MAKIVVTGATGFIGKRLIYKLLDEGHEVYALIRNAQARFSFINNPRLAFIVGTLSDPMLLPVFPVDIDASYYLVHSMRDSYGDLKNTENIVANNFLKAINLTSCKQIIYLSGIVEDEKKLSVHLQSRLAVEKVLQKGRIPCSVLRASIIIGAGSASFEIIRDLTEKLPIMVAPKWVKNLIQPISIVDVLFYLTKILLNKPAYGKTYDIGGPEALTFREVLLRYAKFRALKRLIINVPFFTPKLSGYWLLFITSVNFSICKYLVESMKQNTRKLNDEIDRILPHECLSFEQALTLAFQRIAQNEVVSSWMDAWDLKTPIFDIDVPKEGCLTHIVTLPNESPLESVRAKIWTIGGKSGWYSMNWAWKLRGLIDKLVGGTGFNRGRRDQLNLKVGDSIDFWRVLLEDKQKIHLILFAQMKLPGEAWLEFELIDDGKTLRQTATFRPRGLFGYIYWYAMIPFHIIIFKNMAKKIVSSAS